MARVRVDATHDGMPSDAGLLQAVADTLAGQVGLRSGVEAV